MDTHGIAIRAKTNHIQCIKQLKLQRLRIPHVNMCIHFLALGLMHVHNVCRNALISHVCTEISTAKLIARKTGCTDIRKPSASDTEQTFEKTKVYGYQYKI